MPEEPKKELSDAEKRRKRREARQKKILAAAGDRLQRITTAHGGDTPIHTSPLPSQQSSPTGSETNPFSQSRKSSFSNTSRPSFSNVPRPQLNHSQSDLVAIATQEDPTEAPSLTFSNVGPEIKISEATEGTLDVGSSLPITQDSSSTSPLPPPPPPPTPHPSGDQDNDNYTGEEEDRIFQQIAESLRHMRTRNASSTSIESVNSEGGPGEPLFPMPPSFLPPSIEEQFQQQIQQMQFAQQEGHDQAPLPLFPFMSPEMMLFGSLTGVSGQSAQETSQSSRYWNSVHFALMVLLGLYTVLIGDGSGWIRYSDLNYYHPRDNIQRGTTDFPLFWYFTAIELSLQSTRLLLQKDRIFRGSAWGNIAASLPYPFSDILKILLRYRLIWNSLWEDAGALVFIIGNWITFAPFFAYWIPGN